MNKINIVGTSGSGKSTFGKQLASTLNIPYVEMDALFWQPDWQQASDETFFDNIQRALSSGPCVLDGNYTRSQAVKWQHIDTIIWLDYGFFRTFYQVLIRSIKRAWYKHELWPNTGNKESFRKSFTSKDSIILWMLTNYHRNKHKYQNLMGSPELSDKTFIRLTSPKHANQWLETIAIKE